MASLGRRLPSTTSGQLIGDGLAGQQRSQVAEVALGRSLPELQLATASSSISATGSAPKLVPSGTGAGFPFPSRPLRQRRFGASGPLSRRPGPPASACGLFAGRPWRRPPKSRARPLSTCGRGRRRPSGPRPGEAAKAAATALVPSRCPLVASRRRGLGVVLGPAVADAGLVHPVRVELVVPAAPRTGEMVAGTVGRHPVEPGREPGFPPKAGQAAQGPQSRPPGSRPAASSSLPVSR